MTAPATRIDGDDQNVLALPDTDWAWAFFTHFTSPDQNGKYLFNITHSAKAAGVTRQSVLNRRKIDPAFNILWQQAEEHLLELLEGELARRTVIGHEKPVYQQGRQVGTIVEVDNRLLTWALERLAPDKYHLPTRIELTQAGNSDGQGFTFRMGETEITDTVYDQLEPGDDPETPGENGE